MISRTDLVSKEEIAKIKALIKTLNPTAKLLESVYSRIDITEILNTKRFDYETAALSAGWLKSLNEEIIPESEEYGIGSCESDFVHLTGQV